jgi:WD40 repeat protein
VDSGHLQASIEGYSSWVNHVDVSADSRYVAAEGDDDIIRVFEISNFLPSRQSMASNVIAPIYFLPTNRQPQADIPEKIDQMLKDVQSFFADEMERHGYGRKSFEFEKNSDGSAKVYLFEGETTDKYYKDSANSRVMKEISQHFNAINNILLIIVDKSQEVKTNKKIKTYAELKQLSAKLKRSSAKIDRLTFQVQGFVFRKQGGKIVLDKSLDSYSKNAIILEFAETFGLNRDYRSPSYLMSYSDHQSKHLSKSSAAWLNKCKFFNSVETYFDNKTEIGKLSRSRRIARFKVEDADGICQVRLIVKPSNEKPPPVFQWKSDPAENQSVWKRKFHGSHGVLHDFITLNGEKKATIELDYPTHTDIPFRILVIDELGNRIYKYTKKRRNLFTSFMRRILN